MASLIGMIITIAIAAVVVASVLMYTINNTNTTGWSTGTVALWGTAGLICIAGFIFLIAKAFGMA